MRLTIPRIKPELFFFVFSMEYIVNVNVSRGSYFQEHWSSFIVEDDFKFIARNGLNAVRIPVGWWITSDPTPPWPYVGGSLHALDNAFSWAK